MSLHTIQNNRQCIREVKKRVQAEWSGWRRVWVILFWQDSSKGKGEGLQDASETCYHLWFENGGTNKKTGGAVWDVKIVIVNDQDGQD